MAERVSAAEYSLGEAKRFYPGTVLRMLRGPHAWGALAGVEYCTVKIDGVHYNVVAEVLQSSVQPKES